MSSSEPAPDRPSVFFDEKGRRRKVFGVIGIPIAIVTTVLFAFFVVSVLVNPFLPQIKLKPLSVLPERQDTALAIPDKPAAPRDPVLRRETEKVKQAKKDRLERKRERAAAREMEKAARPVTAAGPTVSGKPLSVGFYVNWDDSSFASLKQNIDSLDWVVPEWIRLSGDPDNPLALDIDDKALDFIHSEKPDMPVLPLLQNYKNEQWNSDLLRKTIATEDSRQKLIASLLSTIDRFHFGGITVDIEEVPKALQPALFLFVSELHTAFQVKHLVLAQAVPFDNPEWNYRSYAAVTDYVMLMAYDQHWSTGEAGPVAGQDWFADGLKRRMAEIPPEKAIVCIGNYGYNWGQKGTEAETVSVQEALLAAKDSLDSPSEIKFDPDSKNPYFTYTEDDGVFHSVWFLDAVTAYNEIKVARPYNVAGLALWRLGSEDPSLWTVFGSKTDELSPSKLDAIKYGYDVTFEGTGEILQVKAEPQDGARDLKLDPSTDLVSSETYKQIPSSYVIRRTGDKPGEIALTFDDGPDPVWTPKILDVLKKEGVKATFFIVGENGEENPEVLKRIVAEGHTIGNHSFTHANLAEVPNRVALLELNTTQRLIESLTGRSTRLFRAPYFGDAEPRTPDEMEPTARAQDLGYISVGLHLDPDDWKLVNDDGTPHTAEEITNQVFAAAAIKTPEERGSIVLLHDAGGDRSATVAALPGVIEGLRAKGYKFTTVADLAGLSEDQVMPPVQQDQSAYAKADSYVFYSIAVAAWLMKWIFLIGIILGIGRMVIIGVLAFAQYLRSRRREHERFGAGYEPFVSVIVPAYNEEKVVCQTISSLLESDYPSLEIIVVDDGSTDGTFKVATDAFPDEPRLRIITKENGGKAAALNLGWRQAKGEIIIALDADTLFTSTTVSELAHRFKDERIGAVAGNAKVGNRLNLVTKWQALEYVTSQNFDRRAFASLNCITVVPGSVGAWRRRALEETGGFSSDTLAEDQDLTIQVRKLGLLIGYEENAIGFTEAPATLRELAKQRFRWSFGTLQCMWKHKNALLNPRFGTLGFIAMPNVWIFQILFPLISPLMDLMFIWSLIAAVMNHFEHQEEYAHSSSNLNNILFYYALFLAVDWLGALAAFLMEKREQKKLLWWLAVQRFGYRQVMYWVMVKSVYMAIKGVVVGWGKLERKATVEAASP